jgi:class 3 adenylate cyclase
MRVRAALHDAASVEVRVESPVADVPASIPAIPEVARPLAFVPGWDRRDAWTQRFQDPSLELAYEDAMAQPGSQRLCIAHLVGAGIWTSLGIGGPILLGLPAAQIYAAAAINAGWELIVGVFLTFRQISLPQVWAVAVFTTTISALSIILAFGTGQTFVTVGVAALMTNAVFGIALVRPAGWVAAGLGALTVLIFAVVTLLFDLGGLAAFQAILLIATLAGASLGARFLEAAERTAFAQGHLVADLHRKVDRLFRQYLSPDVAQALVDDPTRANLGGDVAEVSVLFADLQGFTAFSERTPAAEVVAMLNTAFGAAVPAVLAEGGTVVQFMGDALMAVFNAPIRQEDHALRACRAGLALQHLMNETDGAAGNPRFRVGINSGPALVGNIGSAELHNFLAIGDTTNVAARLQSYASPGTVVLGQQTYELVRERVEVRPLGVPDLKGKSKSIAVYELTGLRS